MFKAAEGTRLYPFVITAACSGCHRGELLALTWPDIDFDKGILTVAKSLEQTRAGLRVKSTKSEEPRTIGLDDDFALEVGEHRQDQAQDKIHFGSRLSGPRPGLCQPNGDSIPRTEWARG